MEYFEVITNAQTGEVTKRPYTQSEIAKATEGQSKSVRETRDQLIAETDWWATADRTMTAEQTAYRQALRDITDQAGFPHNVTWPTKP